MKRLEEGALPKQTIANAIKGLKAELKSGEVKPLKLLGILQTKIAEELLKPHAAENPAGNDNPREIILSEYMIGE